jgi:hypothetical protein
VPVPRFHHLADLTDAACLGTIAGPVARVSDEPLTTVGFSGASHRRVLVELTSGELRRYVVKTCDSSRDWVARRSGDHVGREWCLLAESALDGVWEAFVSPFVAFATEDGRYALLMEDLSAHVFPDVREPIRAAHEHALIRALATLHARFWESHALTASWLGDVAKTSGLVTPDIVEDREVAPLLPPALAGRLREGWAAALERLTADAVALVSGPAASFVGEWADLPRTLVHGDVKVANFAPIPDRGVAAFDWAIVGTGPATTDLGWYLGVNATRLACSKEELIARYRRSLETALGRAVDDTLWARLEDVAIVHGARTMLWSKGAQLKTGTEQAIAEWTWWQTRLEEIARRT